MRHFKILFILLLLVVFTPKVYAFTFDMTTNIENDSVNVGEIKEIEVALKDIQGAIDGIVVCSLNISFDNNILLDSRVRTLNNWTMTSGKTYLFDTGTPVSSEEKMFVIPVKVNETGSVKITNIECSDGETSAYVNDKVVSFVVNTNDTDTDSNNDNDDNNGNNNGNGSNNDVNNNDNNANGNTEETNSCDLMGIKIGEGFLSEFDPAITEYYIKVSDFESLKVIPTLESSKSSCNVERNIEGNGGSVVLTVNCGNNNSKVYTIYVEEVASDDVPKEKDNNMLTPIFIGIICVLVLINIVRIIKNMKK